jgi:hypothetical protein
MIHFILFSDPSIKGHFCLSEHSAFVKENILKRYGVFPAKEETRSEIFMDPGGAAYASNRAEYCKFDLNGVSFKCQTIHQPALYHSFKRNARVIDSPFGKLVRLYGAYSVIVLPADWYPVFIAQMEARSDTGEQAVQEFEKVLSEVQQKINERADENLEET